MRTLNIVKFSAAMLGVAAIATAGPAFALSHGGGGHFSGGSHFSAGANFSSPGVRTNNAVTANRAGPMNAPMHMIHNGHWNGHDHGHFGGGHGGYGWGYGGGWGYPDYAYDYGYDYPYDEGYYDNGYDNSYAGAEGTYCQTPVRSCGIPEAATVGTPCGCRNSAGTVWGQVQ